MKLEIRDISFSYSGKEILSSVSFILNSGDVTALLGRNGSGKTTLMRLILGFIKPDSGAIMLDGRDIREMSSKDRAKVIAYIPQKLSDAYPYSVFDSVMMGRAPSLSVFSSPKEKDREKAEEALALLGISNLKDRNVNTLSGGERQLVLIARAITQEASFMVMDEPTSALDYANALMVMEKTEELRKEGYGILYSTHNPELALQNCSSVILLSETHSEYIENPGMLKDGKKLSALYGRNLSVRSIDTEKGERLVCVPV